MLWIYIRGLYSFELDRLDWGYILFHYFLISVWFVWCGLIQVTQGMVAVTWIHWVSTRHVSQLPVSKRIFAFVCFLPTFFFVFSFFLFFFYPRDRVLEYPRHDVYLIGQGYTYIYMQTIWTTLARYRSWFVGVMSLVAARQRSCCIFNLKKNWHLNQTSN